MIRVRLTNAFGARPLHISAATIMPADDAGDSTVIPPVKLTFSGRRFARIPPRAELLSDPAPLPVRPLERLAVSLFVARPSGPPTLHGVARQDTFIADGNHVGDPDTSAYSAISGSWYFLDSVDVLTSRPAAGTVVAFGDSITDGVGSSVNGDRRWPNDLARRLNGDRGTWLSVVDAGIGGNRVLTSSEYYGVRALSRFRRDVLARAGVGTVILLEGINDIGFGHATGRWSAPHRDVSAEQITHGYKRLIVDAHAAGVRVIGGTLLPFFRSRLWTLAGERERETVNRWIRDSGAFDGVVDFASVMADESDPAALRASYDSGDHLHPNDAGYQAMADAVDPALLTGS